MRDATVAELMYEFLFDVYRLIDVERRFILPSVAVLISLLWFVPSFAEHVGGQEASAQDIRTLDDFMWKKDVSTGNELAASRSDSSFNYLDVGDLSYYSDVLAEQDLRRIAAAAGLALERGPTKNATIAIFHDSKVFSRLRDDKPAFNSLGLPNNVLAALEKQATDTSKCLNMTLTDERNDIGSTIVLLSERFDGCLVSGLPNSFGIAASEISAGSLIDVCILYEGRRRGVRDRQGLAREIPELRNLCMAKAGNM